MTPEIQKLAAEARRRKAAEWRANKAVTFVPPASKICKDCGKEKPLRSFGKHKSMRDGHLNSCKECRHIYEAAWKRANPEKVKKKYEEAKKKVRILPIGTTQMCKVCGIVKELTEFRSASRMKLGVRKECLQCDRKSQRSHPNHRARVAKWTRENPEARRVIVRRSYERHKVERLAARKAYRERNLDAEKSREKRYSEANRTVIRAKNGRRRAAESRAVPKWLTAIQKAQIQEFYDIASARTMQTGIKHHVDHNVPLRGHGVCGLHVPWNLQVLTEAENCSKHNKFDAGA